MKKIDHALALAEKGFHVFPCEVNGKLPVIKDFPNQATRDPERIKAWWDGRDYNIGISTTRFGDDKALVVVDVDVKNGKNGYETILGLEFEGRELPPSYEQSTPTGGKHIVYVSDDPCKQGTDVLGKGLDIRSRGGYILGAGSVIEANTYQQFNGHSRLVPVPAWVVDRSGRAVENDAKPVAALDGVDTERAESRGLEYIQNAPASVEGEGGDQNAYRVAAKLKDFGCTEEQAFSLMEAYWNDRCIPPWEPEELWAKVQHAYRYGREPVGSAAPEAVFHQVAPVPTPDGEDDRHPADRLNDEYAFVKAGAYVLQETVDADGNFRVMRLSPPDMHAWFNNKQMQIGDKRIPLSRIWMASPNRREYEDVIFRPGRSLGARFYNLWRGFVCEPASTPDHPSVEMFKEHALKNVCGGDHKLFRWLIGFFAHMIQFPGEKPLVALVFKGKKGTGKNALVERVGALLGRHFMVADDDRYLLGNFNAYMEANMFFVLDEASWAGDKRAEGKLKGIITGAKHNIERKGYDAYQAENFCRVAIIGNEKWLVPATEDERRFAVFTMGEGRRKDRAFFKAMQQGMEQGGYPHLLRYLLDFDLTGIDVNDAPETEGLIAQKHASLEPFEEWWLEVLYSNELVGSSYPGALPDRIPTNRIVEAFKHWANNRNIRSRLPGPHLINKALAKVAKTLGKPVKHRPTNEADTTYAWVNPGIEKLRADWESFIGGTIDWSEGETE